MSAFQDPEICRSILESVPTGLCVVDLQKRIVLWSDGAERITGHLRHDVIGHCCIGEPVLHCDQQDCEFCHEDCPLARAMKTSQPAEAMGFLHHKAGHEIPVRARAVPVRNGRGSIIGAVQIFDEQLATALPNQRPDALSLPEFMDELTGLNNRVMMQAHLRETLGTFADVKVPFGILLVQLEGMEQVRARLGQDAAISLLRVAARVLEGTLWRTDFVGRWSDDQFLVILNGCRDEALHAVRQRVQRMLASDGIEWWGERRTLHVSIGAATAQPGDSMELLLTRAQRSLDAVSQMKGRAAGASGDSSSEDS